MTGDEIVIRVACYAFIGLVLRWNWNREDSSMKEEEGMLTFLAVIWPLAMIFEAYFWAESKYLKRNQ